MKACFNPHPSSLFQKNFESQVLTKRYTSFYLTENNLFYIWGICDDTTERTIPTLLTLPNNERISFIACSCHIICLTENNLCYVWGYNKCGELGLGDTTNRSIPTSLSLPNNERISFITCGENHTICLTENNLCYVWGDNLYGQLGLGDTTNRSIPTSLSLPNNEKIYFITCGLYHTICLTENNLCYVWGDNRHGQLGLGHTKELHRPALFSLPNNERISFITCGSFHTICLTENNLCYVWGSNDCGQLGLGDTTNRFIPASLSLPNNERISFITCGENHAICLTENNLCYVWGGNVYGQLGLSDRNFRSIPTSLSLPNNERISFITCGDYHTICLTENNLCYVWGWNNFGQLGLGDTNNRSSPTLLTLPSTN